MSQTKLLESPLKASVRCQSEAAKNKRRMKNPVQVQTCSDLLMAEKLYKLCMDNLRAYT